jgi:hypothetical protein
VLLSGEGGGIVYWPYSYFSDCLRSGNSSGAQMANARKSMVLGNGSAGGTLYRGSKSSRVVRRGDGDRMERC